MFSLWLTLGAQAIAPLVDALLRGRGRLAAAGDGLVQVIVVGLLLTQVVPEGVTEGGWLGALALAVGLGAAALAHRLPGGERTVAGLALLGLVTHGLGDGLALATSAHADDLLGATVVLHTLPVALATWRVAVAYGGPRSGAVALGITAAATIAGYALADQVGRHLPPAGLAVVQCGVAGAMLHVVGHHETTGPRRAAGLGGVVGLGIVAGVGASHAHGGVVWDSAAHLALAAAPALVVGYVAAGGWRTVWPAGPQRDGAARVRIREGLSFGCVEAVDRTAVWVLAVLWVGALVQPLLGGWTPPPAWAAHGPVEVAALVAVAALFLAALVRQGPRGFVAPMTHPLGHGHEHAHGHE